MRTGCYRIASVVFCGLVSLTSGCAFGTRHATLGYASTPVVSPSTSTGTPISLVRFVDQRGEKRAIGEVRNGYGMRTAEVVPDKDIAAWITQGVQAELEKAGYRVSVSETPTTSSPTATLSGDVVTVYCSAMFSYEGEVSFFARLMKDGKEILAKRYTGKGSAGLNWAATSTGYADSLSLALADAIRPLVEDLHAALRSADRS